MGLPGIEIPFQNGALQTVTPSADKTFAVIGNAVAVGSTFLLDTPYLVTSMIDVAALGLADSVANHRLYKFLNEYYLESGTGSELWIMGVAKTVELTPGSPIPNTVNLFFTVGTSGEAPVHTLLNVANGKIHGLFVVFDPLGTYTSTVTNGLDATIATAQPLAQSIADSYTAQYYAPFFVMFEGYAFNGTHSDLTDLNTQSYNRVGVVIGDTESRTGTPVSNGAALGVLAGRLAISSVHENPGKVKKGSLKPTEIFIKSTSPELYNVAAIHDKGYITFRTITNKDGYFFTDDPLACEVSDDYHYLTRRRTIDKAYRLVYDVVSEFQLDDFDVNADGTISTAYAKTIEGLVENTIFNQMTSNGELSRDATNQKDKGVVCKIDLTHNVTSTSTIKFTGVQVSPKGTGRYLNVPLGFVPVSNNV